MVRINKNALTTKQLDRLFNQLATVISPSNPEVAAKVLEEILGAEERIMVAKRLAAIILLTEGYSMYKIGRMLKLSQSTVERLSSRLGLGKYDYVLSKASNSNKDYFAFLTVLDDILHLGGMLPHYNGLDRYKRIR